MVQLDIFTGGESTHYPSPRERCSLMMSAHDLEGFLVSLNVVEVGREVLGDRIQKQSRGPNYRALCPFHSEKTPSFFLKPEKNLYACYGCGQYGGPLLLAYNLGNEFLADICSRLFLSQEDLRGGHDQILKSYSSDLVASRKVVQKLFREEVQRFPESLFYW